MGRFETTAGHYARFRQGYSAAFTAETADRLGLSGDERLLDLGTGPGLLALAFRPFVASALGVDPEPAMIEAARAAAAAAGLDVSFRLGRAEDLLEDLGPFDLVTIGRALHWMDRNATLARLEGLVAPRGAVVVCGAKSLGGEANPWLETFDRIRKSWAPNEEERHRLDLDAWFAGSFVRVARVETRSVGRITVAHLFERALTLSSTSRAILGDRVETCRRELEEALAPFFGDGEADEVVVATASIFARSAVTTASEPHSAPATLDGRRS